MALKALKLDSVQCIWRSGVSVCECWKDALGAGRILKHLCVGQNWVGN